MADAESADPTPTNEARLDKKIITVKDYLRDMSYEFRSRFSNEYSNAPDPDIDVIDDQYNTGKDTPGWLGVFVDGRSFIENNADLEGKWQYLNEPRYVDEDEAYKEIRNMAIAENYGASIFRDGLIFPEKCDFDKYKEGEWDDVDGGTRHKRAIMLSSHPYVYATLTLSQEDGRVSLFVGGKREDHDTLKEIVKEFEKDDDNS